MKTHNGFTTKKLLHALVIDHSYDWKVLLSWVNCISFGIITNIFPIPNTETDSDTYPDTDNNLDDSEDAVSSETDLERSKTEDESPEKGEKQKSMSGKNRRIVPSH